MPYFPLFIDLSDKLCVVIGAGPVAERKVLSLLDYGPRIRLIAPEATEGLRRLSREGRIEFRERPYGGPEDLAGAALLIAAAAGGVNEEAAADARRGGIPVNAADNPGLCSFFFPALVRRGELVAGISSSGVCPRLSARLRERLDSQWPVNLGEGLEALRKERLRLREEEGLGPGEVSRRLDPLISEVLG